MKQMTFMQACKDFFGIKPGQMPMDFLKEIKSLTEADKQEISEGLKANGYDIVKSAG